MRGPTTPGAGGGPPPAVVAAVLAALAAYYGEANTGGQPAAVRIKPEGAEPSLWRWVGRRESMRGGWPW
jgi:hypothetical protein